MTESNGLSRSESDLTEEITPTFVIDSTRGCKRVSGPTRKSRRWTPEQDKLLMNAVCMYNGKNWKKIAECVPGKKDERTNNQCQHRWQKVLNPNLNKGAWRKEEDELLTELVKKSQDPTKPRWSQISKKLLGGRIGKQCRERWLNHLNPTIKKTPWTREEELILIQAQRKHGNKWAKLAKIFPGRTENNIKNHWNCSLKKRLEQFSSSPIFGSGIFDFESSFASQEATKSPQRDSLDLTLTPMNWKNTSFLRSEEETISSKAEISHSTPSTSDHHMSLSVIQQLTTPSLETPQSNNKSVYIQEIKEIRERLRMAASTFKNTPSIISKRSSPVSALKWRIQDENAQTLVKHNTPCSKPLVRCLKFDFP